MPSVVHTPRDRLQRLFDYAVRARRYWWLVAVFVLIGGVLSVGFAVTRKGKYQSTAMLFYQERIQTSVLQGRDGSTMQRNIGDRYRELLLARSQLAKIVDDPELNPFPDVLEDQSREVAIEMLRLSVKFEVRGQNAFRITYSDSDPHRAQKVAQRLTDLLIEKESELRLESSMATAKFAQEQLDIATQEMLALEQKHAQFLVANPEFAEDDSGQSEGAAVRKSKEDEDKPAAGTPSNPRLSALQRQRIRIKARLDAADRPKSEQPVEPRVRTPSAMEAAAQRKVDTAEDEVRGVQRELQAMKDRGLTDAHPDVRKVVERVQQAVARLKVARSELAAASQGVDIVAVKPPANENERAELEKDLRDVESQIASERARAAGGPKPPPTPAKNDIADKVVLLETQWARLRRELADQNERVQTSNENLFRAQLDAQTRIAESGTQLEVIDKAYLPKKPTGKGKKLLVLAGLFVFSALGLTLAVGLAIIDDRIYRRVDIELLDIAPVLGVIPKARTRRRKR
jgi:uncharacterized protein involved in exopolysaccharide biosynthesis